MSSLSWKLRLYHHGYSHISISWIGRDIHFCPVQAIDEDDVAIVLWSWPEHLKGCIETLKMGRTLNVVAPAVILQYLEQFGKVNGTTKFSEAGLDISLHAYEPISGWSIPGTVERVGAGLSRPFKALKRLVKKHRIPYSDPQIAAVTFPSGARLVHLNTAIHASTNPQKLQKWSQEFGNPEWTLSGVDVGHQESWLTQIPQFTNGAILLCDILGDSRRANGLSTPLLTPVVDRAVSKEINAFVFATYASYRYDTVDLVPSGVN